MARQPTLEQFLDPRREGTVRLAEHMLAAVRRVEELLRRLYGDVEDQHLLARAREYLLRARDTGNPYWLSAATKAIGRFARNYRYDRNPEIWRPAEEAWRDLKKIADPVFREYGFYLALLAAASEYYEGLLRGTRRPYIP